MRFASLQNESAHTEPNPFHLHVLCKFLRVDELKLCEVINRSCVLLSGLHINVVGYVELVIFFLLIFQLQPKKLKDTYIYNIRMYAVPV